MKLDGLGMLEQLKSIRGIEQIKSTTPTPTEQTQGAGQPSFMQYLSESFDTVNRYGVEGDQAIQRAIEGKEANPHNTMITLQKADITFRLMMSVQQRLIEAYQQIIRTPIG